MLFRGIIFNALFIGLLTGALLTVIQLLSVNPIIFAAEAYEVSAPETAKLEAADHHGAGEHHHDHEAWVPEDGLERSLYTLLANVLAAIGFSALLMAVMTQIQLQGWTKLSLGKGLLWGGGGFIAFFAMPGIGLPPEIPGIEAAPIESRQSWWLLTVILSAVGLAVFAFAPKAFKPSGLPILALPFLLGAPHVEGPEFGDRSEEAIQALEALHTQFIVATGVANFVFWLVLGAACAWAIKRWVLVDGNDSSGANVTANG